MSRDTNKATQAETLEKMLERHEGRKLKVYRCPANARTIGIGHNIDAKPLPKTMADYLAEHGEITNAMADELLASDIAASKFSCGFIFPKFHAFTVARQNALIDFVFNVGVGTAQKFKKAIHAMNIGHWDTAAEEMLDSTWAKQVKGRAIEITDMIREG